MESATSDLLHNVFKLAVMVLINIWIHHTSEAQMNRCTFPNEWIGLWYQSGLGQMLISDNDMDKKGHCVQHYSDYYILENTESNCVMCLLMLERHDNIIQYKESYCVQNQNIQTICQLIQVEGVMYTLVKETTNALKCPFHGNYLVDYTDYSHSYCDEEARSRIDTCSDTNILQFQFKHCEDTAMWNNADVEFECVANWKEGSENLLYGRFSGSVIANKHDSYRCFKYKKIDSVIYLSMSADATCRGLIAAEAGPVTMKLTKRLMVPEDDCSYPDSLSQKIWVDLSGDHTLTADDSVLILRNANLRRDISRLTCYDTSKNILDRGNDGRTHSITALDGDYFISGYFYRNHCTKNYNCLHIVEMHKSVFLFYVGVIYSSTISAQQCKTNIPEKSKQHIFIDSALQTTVDVCPFEGRYNLPSESDDCMSIIEVGCINASTVHMKTLCNNTSSGFELTFQCKRSWIEGELTNVLLLDAQNIPMCLTIKERQRGIRVKKCKHSSSVHPSLQIPDHMLLVNAGESCTNMNTTQNKSGQHHHRHRHNSTREHHKTTPIPPNPHGNYESTTTKTEKYTVNKNGNNNIFERTSTTTLAPAKNTKTEDKDFWEINNNQNKKKTTGSGEQEMTVSNNDNKQYYSTSSALRTVETTRFVYCTTLVVIYLATYFQVSEYT